MPLCYIWVVLSVFIYIDVIGFLPLFLFLILLYWILCLVFKINCTSCSYSRGCLTVCLIFVHQPRLTYMVYELNILMVSAFLLPNSFSAIQHYMLHNNLSYYKLRQFYICSPTEHITQRQRGTFPCVFIFDATFSAFH